MIKRLKHIFEHYQKRLRENWYFHGYNYTDSERELYLKLPSEWIVRLFTHEELPANRHIAARLLAGEKSDFKMDWADFIIGCLVEAAEDKLNPNEVAERILAKAEAQETGDCYCDFWLELQRALTATGFLQAGGRIRDCALNSLLKQSKKHGEQDNGNSLAVLQAALERGDFSSALSSIEAASEFLNDSESALLPPLVNLFSLRQEISENSLKHIMQFWEPPHRRLHELVQGKRVAIVGPSVTESNLSSEIDAFDIVIRCGFMGSDSLPPGAGEKTSISFYAGHKVRELINRGEGEVLKTLDLILLKHSADRQRLRELNVDDKAIGFALPARQAFFATHPMAIPQVVHNLAFADPNEVKVYKVNFFLEPGYPQGYEIGRELRKDKSAGENHKIQDPAAKCYSFATVHDPLAQIRFMRHVWKCGIIKGDKEFTEIIKLSDEEYLRRLESVFGYKGILRQL